MSDIASEYAKASAEIYRSLFRDTATVTVSSSTITVTPNPPDNATTATVTGSTGSNIPSGLMTFREGTIYQILTGKLSYS